MKTRRMVSIVVVVVFSLVMVGSTAYASFNDIDNNKHKDAVEQMAELGILNGYPDGINLQKLCLLLFARKME